MTSFCWPPTAAGGSGSSGNTSSGLETSGAPVDVSGAAPPVAGQVLTAADATHAAWRVPGLKYDPAIRFNVDAGGTATIEPGTWGFVYTTPVDATSIHIFVVSSLTAPPVDSRFGLYVSPSVTLPVTVSLIGASQIMGLDGTLGTSTVLRPGAMYEWVFYHEGGVAIWGLVSDTAGVAKALASSGAAIDVSGASPPLPGYVLTGGNDPAFASWQPYGLLYVGSSTIAVGTWGRVVGGSETQYLIDDSKDDLQTNDRFGVWWTPSTVYTGVALASGNQLQNADGTFGASVLPAKGQYMEWLCDNSGATPKWYLVGATLSYDPSLPTSSVLSDAASPSPGGYSAPARADHHHVAQTAAPVSLALGGSNQAGTSSSLPRADHVHKIVSSYKEPVRVASTVNVPTLSGLITVDSVPLAPNDRVLLMGQTTQSQNGFWAASSGAWTRTADASAPGDLVTGTLVYVVEGTNATSTMMLTTLAPITIGTTNLTFVFYGGPRTTTVPVAIATLTAPSSGASPKWAPIDHAHGMDSLHPSTNNWRLSTQAASSVAVDGSFSTLYMAMHTGNRISLYDGTKWIDHVPGGSNIVLSGMTSGIPQDIFITSQGSRTLVLLERVAWTNATTRAVGITQQDGVWVKSGNNTRRYLGTILPDSASTFTIKAAGSATKAVCGLWNQDNRIKSSFTYAPTFATWSPASANVWAEIGGVAAPHIEIVVGQAIDSLSAQAVASVGTSTASAVLGIGIDSATAPAGFQHFVNANSATVGVTAHVAQRPTAIGRKTVNLLAFGTTTAPVFYGVSSSMQSGLTLDVWH